MKQHSDVLWSEEDLAGAAAGFGGGADADPCAASFSSCCFKNSKYMHGRQIRTAHALQVPELRSPRPLFHDHRVGHEGRRLREPQRVVASKIVDARHRSQPGFWRRPIGALFTAYHPNTTTVLRALYETGKMRCFAHPSMLGGFLYTEGGPATRNARLVEVPCTLLNAGHLEQIFNHAMHILYTEGPRNSSGPGFSVEFTETGRNFSQSRTDISIRFYFNGYPVQVTFARSRTAQGNSPCILSIVPSLWSYECPPDIRASFFSPPLSKSCPKPPEIIRTSRLLYWEDEHKLEEDKRSSPSAGDVEVWTDDGSFCDIDTARALGWDVSNDPREIARRAEVQAHAAAARVAEQEAAEEKRRREEQAKVELRRRHEIHDALIAVEKAEEKAKTARRAHEAALARAARAAAPPKPHTSSRSPPGSKKAEKKAARGAHGVATREGTASQLEHNVHVVLPEQCDTQQEMAHTEKVACEARDKVKHLRLLHANASMEHEAATHMVPTEPTVNGTLVDAMQLLELL
jgi:hypothetical protein